MQLTQFIWFAIRACNMVSFAIMLSNVRSRLFATSNYILMFVLSKLCIGVVLKYVHLIQVQRRWDDMPDECRLYHSF